MSTQPDLYCVFGNPIGHSRSPAIHARFAAETDQCLHYEARLAPLDNFAGALADFARDGGLGANVTVPFKEEAFALSTHLTWRARLAGAVNTLKLEAGGWLGDNTDGIGLVLDITHNLKQPLSGLQILLLGAGGAARGVIAPLLVEQPASLHLANRSADKAEQLRTLFADLAGTTRLSASGFADLPTTAFDLVINATSASLGGNALPLADSLFAPQTLAYDMMYGKGDTPFLAQARAAGAGQLADGLGMLVEQAAEAFALWRGIRPATQPVLTALRAELGA